MPHRYKHRPALRRPTPSRLTTRPRSHEDPSSISMQFLRESAENIPPYGYLFNRQNSVIPVAPIKMSAAPRTKKQARPTGVASCVQGPLLRPTHSVTSRSALCCDLYCSDYAYPWLSSALMSA